MPKHDGLFTDKIVNLMNETLSLLKRYIQTIAGIKRSTESILVIADSENITARINICFALYFSDFDISQINNALKKNNKLFSRPDVV